MASDENTFVNVQLYDMYGKQILNHKNTINTGKNNITLNTSELGQGVYLINVTNLNTNLTNTVKIVK